MTQNVSQVLNISIVLQKSNLGIRFMTGTPFHPEPNGRAESAVKIIKNFIQRYNLN